MLTWYLYHEKRIRGGIARAIHHYVKANKKYLFNYDEIKKSSFNVHLDLNNQCGWTLSEPILYGGFEYAEDVPMFTPGFTGYTLLVGVGWPEYLQQLQNDLPLLPEESK